MSIITEVMFFNDSGQECPFIFHIIKHECSDIGGQITFEGFYNVDNEMEITPKYTQKLPQTMKLRIRKVEPIISTSFSYKAQPQQYRSLEEYFYDVVIYKLETHTKLKHINKHTLYFRVLDDKD
jgi:hypothetical protein